MRESPWGISRVELVLNHSGTTTPLGHPVAGMDHQHKRTSTLETSGRSRDPRQAPDCARLRQSLLDSRLGTWWTQSWHDDRADDRGFGPYWPCQQRTCPLQSHDRCRSARRSRRNRSRRPSFLHVAYYGIQSERIVTGSLTPTLFACLPMIPPMCSSFAVSSPRSSYLHCESLLVRRTLSRTQSDTLTWHFHLTIRVSQTVRWWLRANEDTGRRMLVLF